jgi:tetratricopeptide (TPR) repeat protein
LRRVSFGASVPLCLGASLVSSCSRGRDHERLGDQRYAEQSWVDALAEYRLAARQKHPSVELRVKLGSAAIRAGAFTEAATAWRDLAAADQSAHDEAAEGLVRTARAAIEARDVAGLRAAVFALQQLAPGRLAELGPSLVLALEERQPADSAIILVAAAMAYGTTSDSLVAVWADAAARAGQCAQAVRAFESVLRRAPSPALTRVSKAGLSGCQVDAGRAALAAGDLEAAEASFRAAIAVGMPDSTVRLAWVLIGDARWAGGDTTQAIEAYTKAIANADDENPIAQRAREQLAKLQGGTPSTP